MERKILWDCHMHSSFSADSSTPMLQMIEAAIAQNLEGICFTEHLDPDYPPTPEQLDFSLDIPSYKKQLYEYKETFKDKLQISYGIELGLQPHLEEYFDTFLKDNSFDFIIGSSHVVHGFDPYYPEFFKNRKESVCYMEYFESILENLAIFSNIDTYGHLDYIVRYGEHKNSDYSYGRYCDILDEILATLIEKQIGLEINTGGYHYGLGEPNPCKNIIRRYKELGGEIITIGADAHTPDKIGYAFEKAASLLSDCGFRYYTVFKNRQPEFKLI